MLVCQCDDGLYINTKFSLLRATLRARHTSCWYRVYEMSPEEHVLLLLCQQVFDIADQVQFLKMSTVPDEKTPGDF